MRILLVNSAFHPRLLGGAEFATWILARALSRRGHEVSVLATTARRDEGRRDGLETRSCEGVSGRVFEASSGGWQNLLVREGERRPSLLRRGGHHFTQVYDRRWHRLTEVAIEECAAEVVHSNTLVGLSLAVWTAARSRGVPVVHTLHDAFLACPRTTLLRSTGQPCSGGPLPCQVLRGLKRHRSRGIQAVTAPSHFTLRRHLDFGFFTGLPAHVVPNALEGELPPPTPPPTADGRGLFLGALESHKGVDLLCEVLDRFLAEPGLDFGFDFAGDGGLRPRVEALAAKSDGRVRYHGVVHGDPKASLLEGCSFVVAPSRCEESFGRTLIDAYAHGRAVVASTRGAMPEVVEDGGSGWLVEPEVEALDAALRSILSSPEELRRRGARARQLASRYSLDRHGEDFEKIYAEVVRRG